ncbi:ATP-binding cassette domain-containing protein [Gordonia aurantiaca]|uniref:ATP-binding cassette domain-containing protein n=1 Tax=Gordonia sp. B21 TaxID=3151852 RepID=UPI003264ABDF
MSKAPQPGGTPSDTPLIEGRGLSVEASWGHIFGPIDLRVLTGGVTVLAGPDGRGRTALLLTLAGRMRPSSGELSAFGRTNDAQHLFNQAAVAWIDEVDGIQQAIRVRDVVTELIRWSSPWWKWVTPAREDDLERVCRPVFGPYPLPDLESFVEELPELTAALFRIAIGNHRQPPLLVVGGVDKLTRRENQIHLMERLVDLGRSQTVITADINAVSPSGGVRDVIPVANLTDGQFIGLEHEDRT